MNYPKDTVKDLDDAPMAVIELVDRNIAARKVDKPKKVVTKDKKTPETAQVASK